MACLEFCGFKDTKRLFRIGNNSQVITCNKIQEEKLNNAYHSPLWQKMLGWDKLNQLAWS